MWCPATRCSGCRQGTTRELQEWACLLPQEKPKFVIYHCRGLTRRDRQDLLNPQVMLPPVGDIIHIQAALARAQAEGGQRDGVRVVGEPQAAQVGNAVVLAMDGK